MSKPELYSPIYVHIQNLLIGMTAQNMRDNLTEIGRFSGSFLDYSYDDEQVLTQTKCAELVMSGWRRLKSDGTSTGVTHMSTSWIGKDGCWRTTIRGVLVHRLPQEEITNPTDLGWRARYLELTLDTVGHLLLYRADHASQDKETRFHIPSDFHELVKTLREKLS